jgi:hypothetical protein
MLLNIHPVESKTEPQKASGFMSMLPTNITNLFSNDKNKDLQLHRKM